MPDQVLIFAHIPKTGGSWVNHVLRSNFGTSHCSRFIPREEKRYFETSDLEFARRVFPALKSVSSHSIRDPARWIPGQQNCFTLIREPLARTASAYQYKVQKGLFADQRNAGSFEHFEDWLARPENRDYQVQQIAGVASLERVRQVVADSFFFVGLTDRLEESIDTLARLSPLPINTEPCSPHRKRSGYLYNRAADNSLSKVLLNNPYTRELLVSANSLDTGLYRWVKEERYPRYVNSARLTKRGPVVAAKARQFRFSKLFNNVVYSSAQRLRYRKSRTNICHDPVW